MNTPLGREQIAALLLLLAAPVVATLVFWSQLPEAIPIHWNWRGEIDRYVSKPLFLLYNVGMGAFLFALFHWLPLLDPKRRNYERFGRTYGILAIVIVAFTSFVSLLILAVALGYPVSVEKILPSGVFLLLAVIGNYLTTVKPNYFVGIRTPWTLESDFVWRKTHQFGGRLWFFGGLLLATFILFTDAALSSPVLLGGVLTLSILPILYSYWVYRKVDPDDLV